MADLQDLVISAIEDDLLSPALIDAAVARAVELLQESDDERDAGADDAAQEIRSLDAELQRLTMLAASGASDIPAVMEGLRTRQDRKRSLVALLSRSARQRPATAIGADVASELRWRCADWRSLLRRNVAEARPVVELLLGGRVVVTPRQDSPRTAPVFDVRVPLSQRAIFEGICGPNGVASPAGFEPALPA